VNNWEEKWEESILLNSRQYQEGSKTSATSSPNTAAVGTLSSSLLRNIEECQTSYVRLTLWPWNWTFK